MHRTGIDLRTTVAQLKQSSSGEARRSWEQVEADLMRGSSLADAMQRQADFFPQLTVALVEAGERGGRLEQAAERLSLYYKALLDLRRSFLASIAWPMFELVMAVLILGGLILILGFIGSMTNTTPIDPFGLGWTTRQYFLTYCGLVLGGLASMVLVHQAVARGWLGSWPLDIARRIPLLGRTIEIMALGRTAWALATAYEAGLSAVESVRLGLKSTQQWYYQRHQAATETSIRRGQTLTQALRDTQALPLDFVQAIETGELSGTIPESLEHLAQRYDQEAQRNLRALSVIGGVMIMLLIFLSLGMVVIYMYKTIYIDRLMELGRGF